MSLHFKEKNKNKTSHVIFCNGRPYNSAFQFSTDSGISFCHVIDTIKKSEGGPAKIKALDIITEEWIFNHPWFLFPELKHYETA